MKKVLFKLTSVIMAITLLFANFTVFPASAKDIYDPPLNIGVASDLHFLPESLINIHSADFQLYNHTGSQLTGESAAILKATLKTIAERKAQGKYTMKYLFVPGDLTADGEKAGHKELASILREFEKSTGIQVYVINGNHDVNDYNAASYASPDGVKITASQNPELLLTTPEDFKEIYKDFGYAQADSVFEPSSGKAGMLSYSVSLSGGYRLIAIDSCIYSADVTADGTDKKEGGMNITPELLDWVLKETREATARGETVIGMAHGSIVEHFNLERALSSNSIVRDYENISYQLADAGMHFVFTGHMHSNDVASIVSANNEIIYDIETCSLINTPDTYREVSFTKTLQNQINCRLNNVDCDAECNVDVSNVSDKYGIIEKPFFENYCMPVLYGGSIENGIRCDIAGYVDESFIIKVPQIIKETFPNGLAGLLKDNGINLAEELTKASPALRTALMGYNLNEKAFSQFLGAIVKQIDDKYILNTDHTVELVREAVKKFSRFEICEGNSDTQFGKIAMMGLEFSATGNESPQNYPGLQAAVDTLRTQAGADRFVSALLDIVLNDVLFDDILPSISLNDLDKLLPADVMQKLRVMAGDNLTAGGILDSVLDKAAAAMNKTPLMNIQDGRDMVKALVYAAGYQYLNSASRLQMTSALADVIVSFTSDNNPAPNSDFNTTLQYNGKVFIEPTAENYRLPNDVTITKGTTPGDVNIEWKTILGIEGSNIEMSPLPAGVTFTEGVERFDETVTMIDLGFISLDKPRTLLKHSVTITGLKANTDYSFRIGDNSKGLMADVSTFSIDKNGDIKLKTANNENDIFSNFLAVISKILQELNSIDYILRFFI